MNNEDLIDEWDEADFEIIKQWDEEEKNKRLEELEEYVKSDMEIRAKLLTRIDRLNYSLEQANKENKELHSIIKEAREYIKSNEFIGRIRLSSVNKEVINKLLEILDKVGGEK